MSWVFGTKHQLEELKRQMDAGNSEAALSIADGIADFRLKNYADLMLVARAYKKSGDYHQAKQLYGKAKEKRSSRAVVLELLDCCLETKDTEEADKYFDEFHKLAPDDTAALYAYRYKIEKCKNRDTALLIQILEELKAIDYTEEYAYELAEQYHKAGKKEECIQECQEIILWFAEGDIVERAKALLAYYKGEISLEEIGTVGERYAAKQQEPTAWGYEEENEEEDEEEEGMAVPEAPLEEESAPALSETPFKEESAPSSSSGLFTKGKGLSFLPKLRPKEEAASSLPKAHFREETDSSLPEANPKEETSPSLPEEAQEDTAVQMPRLVQEEHVAEHTEGQEEEELPVIDLSCLDFSEEEEDTSREPYELYFYDTAKGERADSGAKKGKAERLLANRNVSLEETCKSFARVSIVRRQILRGIEQLQNEQGPIFLAVTGEEKTGKTTLALSMVRLLYRLRLLKHDRTAVIDAAHLNEISVADKKEELRNCNLLVERAGGLREDVLEELLRFFGGRGKGTCLILEDTEKAVDGLLCSKEGFGRKFSNRLSLPSYTAEELFGFAYDRIEAEDYAIDKPAAEVLKQKIRKIVQEGAEEKRLSSVLGIVEQALSIAEQRNNQTILKMAAAGRFQTGNFFVLLKEDIEACTA